MNRQKIDSVVHIFLTTSVILLFASNVRLFNKVNELGGSRDSVVVERQESICDADCQEKIAERLKEGDEDEIVPEVTTSPVTTSGPEAQKQTTYIALGTSTTTTKTDWTDVEGTEVYIDLKNDFGEGATASWEASLKVAHANGTAYARLFDATNSVAVDGSEISVTDKDTLTFVSSGNLPFWSGRNLYKVQIRSLNSFEVTHSGGRVKIVH